MRSVAKQALLRQQDHHNELRAQVMTQAVVGSTTFPGSSSPAPAAYPARYALLTHVTSAEWQHHTTRDRNSNMQ